MILGVVDGLVLGIDVGPLLCSIDGLLLGMLLGMLLGLILGVVLRLTEGLKEGTSDGTALLRLVGDTLAVCEG